MRFTMMSILMLVGLLFASASTAGHHEAGEQADTAAPPVEANVPDTPIAAPAAPGSPDDASADDAEAAEADTSAAE